MLYYTSYDMNAIMLADNYATAKHIKQTRKDGSPYIFHPRGVSVIAGLWAAHTLTENINVRDSGYSRLGIIRVSSLLHDLIEDQGVTQDEIASFFGEVVAAFVQALSNNKAITDEAARNEDYCNKLRQTCIDVQLIKLADIYHNATSVSKNPSWKIRWCNKAKQMLASLTRLTAWSNYGLVATLLADRHTLAMNELQKRQPAPA